MSFAYVWFSTESPAPREGLGEREQSLPL
jgi:hypothetical protein